MATVPYVTSSPWWSAANLNTLCGEFDRRLTLAMAGKTPYLLGRYGACDESLFSTERRFFLPISGYSGDPVVDGIEFPKGVMGAVYAFKGTADGVDVVYFARTNSFSQGAMDTSASSSTEVSHDLTAKTVVVDDSSAAISLEWSLKALRRTVSSVPCWLVPQTTGSRRAMRKHRYAVAELVLEACDTFTVPRTWNRYGCFRLHNLSAIEVAVTVETYESDGTTSGTSHTITIPKFGCRAFRREPGYYDDSLNYFWKARAGLDKRFYQPTGPWVVEQSARANNFANPNIIADWLDVLGAQRDPYVDPPDEGARYTALFGDPSDPETLIHDLIAHTGAAKSIGWDTSSDPVIQSGTIGGSTTLTADLAAMGITLTVVGDTYQLDRDDATAPGEDASGLDLFAMGSNLMWLQAQTVTVPGHTPFSRAEVQRQYSTLPVTLVEDVPVGVLSNPAPSGFAASYPTTSLYSGSDWTVKRLSQIGDAGDSVDGPYSSVGDWILTPFGFAAQWSYSFTHASTSPVTGPEVDPMNGGIWDRWSGVTVSRKSWIHIKSPGWSLGSLKPTRHRSFGKQLYDASGPTFWSTEDWSGILSDPDGNEPTSTGKVLIETPDLKYLSDITGDTVGDVYDVVTLGGGGVGPIDITETRYRVRPDSDEARSAISEIVETTRVQYNQGTPTLEGGETPGYYYHRRPMQIEDYNSLAWMVNGWTRTVPLITIKLLWLKRTDEAGINGFYIPDFEWNPPNPGGGALIIPAPKNCAWGMVPGYPTAAWTKSAWSGILAISERQDIPKWSECKADAGRVNNIETVYSGAYRDCYLVTTPIIPYPYFTWEIFGTEHLYSNSSSVNSTSASYTGSAWDFPDVDSGFYWVTTEEVYSLASAKGLPYVHLVWGQAQTCLVAPPREENANTHRVNPTPQFIEYYDPGYGIPPDLSDRVSGTATRYDNTPGAYINYLTPLDSDEFEFIYDAQTVADGQYELQCFNRGTPVGKGNPMFLSDTYSDESWFPDGFVPYYTQDQTTRISNARKAIGVTLYFSGYTGAQVNSRVLLGNASVTEMTAFRYDGTVTASGVHTKTTVDANVLSSGFTFILPDAVESSPARLIANLYVDLT